MILKLYVNYQLRMDDVVRENIEQDQTASLKVELLLDDFLTIFKWIRLLPRTLCTELKVLFGVITYHMLFIIIQIISLKLMTLLEKYHMKPVCQWNSWNFSRYFIMKQFFNPAWYSWFIPHCLSVVMYIMVKLTKFGWMDWSEKLYQIL